MEVIKLNCLGLTCPEPLTLLRNTIRHAAPRQIIELLSDDPVSLRDIPAFCKFMHHTLVRQPETPDEFLFIIKKGISHYSISSTLDSTTFTDHS